MQNLFKQAFYVAVSFLMVLLLSYSITQFMQSEAVKFLADLLSDYGEEYHLQRQILTKFDPASDRVLVIGDYEFGRMVAARVDSKVDEFTLSEASLNLVADAFLTGKANEYGRVIIQNRPYYWSNMMMAPAYTYGSFSDFTLLYSYGQKRIIDRYTVRLFFTILKKFTQRKKPTIEEAIYPVSLTAVEYRNWPEENNWQFSRLRELLGGENLLWVSDSDNLPNNTSNELIRNFTRRFDNSSYVKGIGKVISKKDFFEGRVVE